MAAGTRQRLIDCALGLLAADGVEAVTLRQIARAAGISHGAPLRHFPSRAALLAAVAATGFAELCRRVDALPSGEPATRLAGACWSYVDFARSSPALFELMFRRDLLAGAAPGSDAVFEQFQGLVAAVQASGWRATADPRLLAASLWASLYGLAGLWGTESDLDEALTVTLDGYLR
ncbi:MAG: TetR/AcrR family transcriptional regulator [Kibdelosporangium sp.]